MLEILIAVTFLAVCASSIVEGIWTANLQSTYAFHRQLVLSALQNQLETIRGLAAAGPLTVPGSSVSQPAISGMPGLVTITTTVSLELHSRVLYDVTATATWTEESTAGTRSDTASLSTVVKN